MKRFSFRDGVITFIALLICSEELVLEFAIAVMFGLAAIGIVVAFG